MKIKIDHSNQDPDQSTASFEQPKPGVYRVQIAEATVRFKESKGKKSLRDIEVVAKVVKDDNYGGAQLWDYISFSEAATWKRDQFFMAIGLMSRKKRELEAKSEKELERKVTGKEAMVRVRSDSYEGEYKAKIAQWMALTEDDEEEDDEEILDDEDLEDEDEVEEDEDEDEEDEDEDDDEDEDEEEEYDLDDIKEMKIKELRNLADELGLDHEGLKKTQIRELIIEELGFEDEAPF